MERYDARTYGDRYADVYDEWYGETWATEDAVDRLIDLADQVGPGPVLELAVGTGRLAVPLAATGRRVVGIDASAAMLTRLGTNDPGRSVAAVQADLAHLPLAPTGPFVLAFVAVNSLFNVFTEEGQARCLAASAAALRPGGLLVVEAFVADQRATGAGVVEPRTIEADRVTLFVSRQDPDAQTITGQIIEITATGNRLRPVHLHYLVPEQIDALAEAAGLERVERRQDWKGTPFTADSPAHVSVYRRTTPHSPTVGS